ncbi:MAG TPA: T9SS type A sorting domain-containing protein, partial [Pelobium sp.]|nr:T9SS type A sorting domain-containing protein [Pelobium sp.]
TIQETAPELELAPATVATECGIATTRTFAVSNPSGLENITSYEWNLGSANNGWLYNGSPAPQNITTSSNTLNLTSVCNATIVKNVGVTVRVNNVNYKSYTSTVSRTGGDTPVITGSSAICGGSANYSINNLACDATVTWSATGNTTFSGGINTGSSITIENNDEEVITLTANISSACGNFTRTKTVTVGVPYFSSGITTSWDGPGQYVVGINTPVHATIDTPYPNATEYSWYLEPYPDAQTYIDNGWPVPSGDTFGSGTHCILTFDVPGDYTMTVKAHTPCGDTNFIGVGYFAVDTATYDGGYSYRAFPNPATDELVVSLNKDSKSPASFREASITKEPTKVSLINDKGKVLREGFIQPAKTSLTFETRDIPAGNYYLHIIRPDKKITKKQIVIKH